MSTEYPEHGALIRDEEGVLYEYDAHTGETFIVTDKEVLAQQGACAYCGDHHDGACWHSQ